MAKIKETIPFSFDDIYAKTAAKFTANGYDYQEGSNTSQLITAMSYLISMLNTNTAVNINENLLTLARKRNNILQDARLLGYEPGNKISYQYQIELTLPAGDFILPKYSEFISGDKKYYYFGEIITLFDVAEGYKLNIVVKEGTLIKSTEDNELSVIIEEFTENGITKNQYYVDIPYTDVEDSGVEAFLTYYDEEGILFNKEQWKEIEMFTVDSDTILSKQFYRLNRIGYNTPRIYFKLPNTGDDLRLGTKIEMNILISSGSEGVITDALTTTLDAEITSTILKIQGTEEETDISIKQNAPLFWNSANRAVTKNDYKSICERLTVIDKSYIWDGNDELPKIPGYIWFSFIPGTFTREFAKDAYKTIFQMDLLQDEENWFLEEAEILEIFNYLDVYKIPTLHFLHRNPVFLDFEFDIEILKYDITSPESTQNEAVFNIIDDYFYKNTLFKLENFGTEFFKSNLIKKIDTQITDITGMNITIKNSMILYNRNIINENSENKLILPLGLPYENYYENNGNLIVANIPDINTTEFIGASNLTVDWSNLTGNEKQQTLVEANILLGTDIIGKYRIFNSKYILVEILVDGTIITESNIDKKILDIKYRTDNIEIVKNTVPRLKKVNFI
jgi:hypothetical protein